MIHAYVQSQKVIILIHNLSLFVKKCFIFRKSEYYISIRKVLTSEGPENVAGRERKEREEKRREEKRRREGKGREGNRTEQNRTEQNRTEQNRTEQNRTEQKGKEQKGKEEKRAALQAGTTHAKHTRRRLQETHARGIS
jgi:hypothetical protein